MQSFKMAKRLCLVDDLKMLKITMSNTSSRNKLKPEINDHYNILTGECQKDELKTKDKALYARLKTQEDQLNTVQALNADALKVDSIVIQNTCSEKEDSNSETAFSKPVKESSLNSKTKDVHAIKYKMSKAKRDAWTYFHYDTFTSTMFLNVDQLQKQLDKDEFQEDGSMIAFWVFRDTLLQHMGNVKKSVAERTRHQRQYDRRVNKRQMQTQESKIDMGKAVDDDLVVTESSGTESEVQDDSSGSGNDTDADDADIIPIYDEKPMAEVQLTAESKIFAIGQQHSEQPKIINECRVD
ncbi:hypothetical protein Tco_0491743 [Tanacetum coccineum]